MSDTPTPTRTTRTGRTVGLIVTGVLAGGLFGALPALAQESTPSPSATSPAPSATAPATPDTATRDGRPCPKGQGGGATADGTRDDATTAPSPSSSAAV